MLIGYKKNEQHTETFLVKSLRSNPVKLYIFVEEE